MCESWYSTSPPACESRVASRWSTSASLTLTRPSTSRSRRRCTVISLRMSLRYFDHGMPSRSTALRKSSPESLLSSAMRVSARSTCVSSTRMPVSFAYCRSTRSVMRRSSSCFSRTSAVGGVTFAAFIWPSTTRFCSLTSYCVRASSLTMAITRSTGTTRSSDALPRVVEAAGDCAAAGAEDGAGVGARGGAGACAIAAVTAAMPASAAPSARPRARRDIGKREKDMRRKNMPDLNIPGRRRRESAATRLGRWSADSLGRCGAGVRVD